jgi:ABC-type polysaccharide/polyol phosphate transport system ATPase subunit
MSDRAVAIAVSDLAKAYGAPAGGLARLGEVLFPWLKRRADAGQVWALQGVSFEVLKGATVGIIGSNGAGKTTLLRLLAGTTSATRGTIAVTGTVSPLLGIGIGFHPELTGRQNVYAGGLYLGLTPKQVDHLYQEIVAFAELAGVMDCPVKTYSAGMYMRLAFALATCLDPDVLLIDEILSVGDAYFSRKCIERIRAYARCGKTIVMASHDLALIQRLCERVLWLDRGRLKQDGDALDVIKAYDRFVRERDDARLRAAGDGVPVNAVTSPRNGAPTDRRPIRLCRVEILDGANRERRVFEIGEPLFVRMWYCASEPIVEPVFVVSVYRIDGVTVCQAISSTGGIRLGTLIGSGYVEVGLEPSHLGAARYVLSAAIVPTVDLLDRVGEVPYDLHDRVYEFSIVDSVECAIDLGILRQPVRWSHVSTHNRPVCGGA